MEYHGERSERIEALRRLMERLCASDLTLDEANGLQGRLGELLGQDGHPVNQEGDLSARTFVSPGGRWHDCLPSGAAMMAAG